MSLVSAIITNWNGKQYLKGCIDSLLTQTYKDIEIILVDCASSDGSPQYAESNYGKDPRVKLVLLTKDPGPSAAINMACRQYAKGDYVMLLNNDVILPANCLSDTMNALLKEENMVITPLQLNFKGEFVPWTFHEPWISPWIYPFVKLFMRGVKGDSIFYPTIACCLTRKSVLVQTPLNENMFYQDTEWGWRLLLKKIRIKLLFNTYFYHADAGTVKGTKKQAFTLGRVGIATIFICLSPMGFILSLPFITLSYLRQILIYIAQRKYDLSLSFIKGFIDFFMNIRSFNSDRIKAQSERQISDRAVFWSMMRAKSFADELKIKSKELVSELSAPPVMTGVEQ